MSLGEYVQQQLTNPRTTDLVLVACPRVGEPKEIRVHSFFLQRSPVFERMFSAEDFQEGISRRAEIQVAATKLLEQMVRFLYTDKMDFEQDAPWSLRDLFDLIALCDQYEVPRQASELALVELVGEMERGKGLAAVEVVKIAAQSPFAAELLGREDLRKAFVRLLNQAAFDEIFAVTKQGLRAGLPSEVMRTVADCLSKVSEFGSGHFLEILAWAREMGSRDASAGVDWKKFQAVCLAKVTSDPELLERELRAVGCEEPSLHMRSARALVLATLAEDGLGRLRRPPWRSWCNAMTCDWAVMVSWCGASGDAAWRFECPQCKRRVSVASAASAATTEGETRTTIGPKEVKCLTHGTDMEVTGGAFEGTWTGFCAQCGNSVDVWARATLPPSKSAPPASRQLLEDVQSLTRASVEQNAKVQELEAALATARAALAASQLRQSPIEQSAGSCLKRRRLHPEGAEPEPTIVASSEPECRRTDSVKAPID